MSGRDAKKRGLDGALKVMPFMKRKDLSGHPPSSETGATRRVEVLTFCYLRMTASAVQLMKGFFMQLILDVGMASAVLASGAFFATQTGGLVSVRANSSVPEPARTLRKPFAHRHRYILAGCNTFLALTALWTVSMLGRASFVPMVPVIQGSVAALGALNLRQRPVTRIQTQQTAEAEEASGSHPLAILRTVLSFNEVPILLFSCVVLYAMILQKAMTYGLPGFSGKRVFAPGFGLILLINLFSVLRLSEWKKSDRRLHSESVRPAKSWQHAVCGIGAILCLLTSFLLASDRNLLPPNPKIAETLILVLEVASIWLMSAIFFFWVGSGIHLGGGRWTPGWLCVTGDQETSLLRQDYLHGAGSNPVRRWPELIWGLLENLAFIALVGFSISIARS